MSVRLALLLLTAALLGGGLTYASTVLMRPQRPCRWRRSR
jgi:hypothetical protein